MAPDVRAAWEGRMRRPWLALGTLALAAALSCSLMAVKIADIKKDPGRYENKTVTVSGKVSGGTKLPFMAQSFYQLDDGSGSIMIVTRKALPPDGKKVLVRGKVESALTIAGQSYGWVIMEDGK